MPAYYAQADAMLVTLTADKFISLTPPGKVQTYMAAGKNRSLVRPSGRSHRSLKQPVRAGAPGPRMPPVWPMLCESFLRCPDREKLGQRTCVLSGTFHPGATADELKGAAPRAVIRIMKHLFINVVAGTAALDASRRKCRELQAQGHEVLACRPRRKRLGRASAPTASARQGYQAALGLMTRH